MHPTIWAVLISTIVFLGTVFALESGYRFGARETKSIPRSHEGINAVEAATFTLFGLLLAFSFAAAASRLESKRQMVIEEGNAMGTAYLRVDLLPAAAQPAVRQQFKRMIDARLRAHEDRANAILRGQSLQTVAAAQHEIWTLSVAALAGESGDARQKLVLEPLNTMFDASTTTRINLQTHLPNLIVLLIVGSALLSAALVGYAMAKRGSRSLAHLATYAFMLALTVYIIIDADYPRFGLITMDTAYEGLFEVRDSMR